MSLDDLFGVSYIKFNEEQMMWTLCQSPLEYDRDKN